jgi:hypothetical protein
VRRLSRSSSRNAYGIGRLLFVRLTAYASKAERSSLRAIDEEEDQAGRSLCAATTRRAFTTLIHRRMGSSSRSGTADWLGVDNATTFP